MIVRRASAYSKRMVTPFTRRSKVKRLSYIKTVPPQKITKFNMGSVSKFNQGKYKNIMRMISEQNILIRDMALEAARMALNNKLGKKFLENYYLACKVYPHQILRDNKTFSGGTKGERVQSGMKHSFGTTMGRAAYVKRDQDLFVIGYVNQKDTAFVRQLCKTITPKFPGKIKILYQSLGQ